MCVFPQILHNDQIDRGVRCYEPYHHCGSNPNPALAGKFVGMDDTTRTWCIVDCQPFCLGWAKPYIHYGRSRQNLTSRWSR